MNQIMKLHSLKVTKCFVFLSFFLINLSNVDAQNVVDLSYCIKTGLERNFYLQVVRNREDITINNYTIGNAGMLPTISAVSRWGGSVNTTNQHFGEREETTNNIHNTSKSVAINLEMNIFRGFQVQRTYEKLGELVNLEGLHKQMAIENLVAQIASEYNYYLQQLILYENLAYSVELSRERVRIDQQRYLLGSASKMELLQSMVYLNADSSRYARQNETLRSSQIRLNELMAADNLGENIVPKDTVIHIAEDLTYDSLLKGTMSFNTGLQIASKNLVVSQLDYEIIGSRSYPYLTMSTGYGLTHYGYEIGDLRTQQIYGMNYGLTLGMNIFDGFNRKREKSNARIEIENRNIQYREVEQAIKGDLLTIYYAYENNLRLLRLEERNLEVAQENLNIALERYKLGSLAGLELREVQKSYLDADERLLSIKYQTKLAEISLLQISGRIMDYM